MGVPQVNIVVLILKWSNDLDALAIWGYPYELGNPYKLGCDMTKWDQLALKDGNGQSPIQFVETTIYVYLSIYIYIYISIYIYIYIISIYIYIISISIYIYIFIYIYTCTQDGAPQ